MTVAPSAIQHLFLLIEARMPSAVLSGIVGDAAHSFGYHLSRADLIARGEPNDYSLALPLDRVGPDDTASALDVSLDPADMITVTNRLLAAAQAHDPRLVGLREFCGTTNGVNTHPYDLSDDQDGPLDSWDSSHLWHVHLSFYRQFCTDAAALAPIADVFCGAPQQAPTALLEDDEMKPYVIEQTDGDRAYWYGSVLGGFVHCARPAAGQIGMHQILASADGVSHDPVRKYPAARITYLINAAKGKKP